jgi:predicted MFS family arabinose efflux permease
MTAKRLGSGMAGLSGIVALTAFDRLSVAPLLAPIALSLHASQQVITLAATVNFIAYGASQVGHGWISDRIGRTRTLRTALVIMGAANILAAAAPTAAVLVTARGIDGAASGGLVPGALVLLADQNLGAKVARNQAALVAALGAGTAAAALAGLADGPAAWRVMFALTALACLALIAPLPPGAPAGVARGHPSVASVLARPEVRFISLIAIPEGAAVFGFIVFFPSVLQHAGWPAGMAALSTGAVGAGMLLGGIVVRPLTGRAKDAHLLLAGAAVMTTGYLLATGHALAVVMTASALTGTGQSAVHTTLQRWATLTAPRARGVSTALFATGAFSGAALATLLGTALPGRFTTLSAAGAACAALSGSLAARHQPPQPNVTPPDQPPGPASAGKI